MINIGRPNSAREGFTLIELLVVIAIIAVLAVVIVLVLNPAELLKQSRDANRLSDLGTLSSALNLYSADQSGAPSFNLGIASTSYVSLLDSSSTCGNLGMPALLSGQSYACASSTSSRSVFGQGWIPVNFSKISAGTPLGSLPVDPVNQTSSNFYYSYATNGAKFEINALLESQKYKTRLAKSSALSAYPEVLAAGQIYTVSPLFNASGLVGYWDFNEGTGSSTLDQAGNGNTGTWIGSSTNGTYYSAGKVGSFAGNFDGATNAVILPPATTELTGAQTEAMWIDPVVWPTLPAGRGGLFGGANPCHIGPNGGLSVNFCAFGLNFTLFNATGNQTLTFPVLPPVNTWTFIAVTWDGTAGANATKIYSNGILSASGAGITPPLTWGASSSTIGSNWSDVVYLFNGGIDDFRMYNRVLSDAEILALYNAEK